MSRVLLISPLTDQYCGIEDYGAPSLGIWRIASFLEMRGHEVSVYDSNLQTDEWLEETLRQHWDIIGISILANTLRLSLEMFLRLKKAQPLALLVAGGPEAIANYQEIFDNTPIDAIILGEGELPLRDLASGKAINEVEGIISRKYATPVTNDLLRDYYRNVDFVKMGWREYWAKNRQMGDEASENNLIRIVTTSHCVRKCSFCSVSALREISCGRQVTPAYLDGEHVRELIEKILRQLPETTHIYFIDDTFLPTPARIGEFCDALRPFRDRVKFLVQTDTDRVTREVIEKLADVGVVHLSCGVENCSPRIRKLIGKPQNEQKIEDIIVWCNEYGIRCYYLVILFPPESTIEDLRINQRTLSRWQEEGNVGVSVMPYMIPYRSARVWYSDFEFEYELEPLSNGKILKQATVIWPRDPEARRIMERFREKVPAYLDNFNRQEGHDHRSKDYTGQVYVQLLGDLLEDQC